MFIIRDSMIMRIIVACFVLLVCWCQQGHSSEKDIRERLNSALKALQVQIDQINRRDHEVRLKFSRLFETSWAKQDPELNVSQISVVPSISIPYKDNLYYTMMIQKNNDFLTLRGDLIYEGPPNTTFLATLRNEFTFFVTLMENKTLVFKKLSVHKKQFNLETETILDLSSIPNLSLDKVLVFYHANRPFYLVGDYQAGRIYCFDKHGTMSQLSFEGRILQIQKVNSYLVVLTQRQLFYLNIQKNYSKTACVWPEESLEYFKFDENSIRSIFAYKNNRVYQYDLGSFCRPVKSYPLPQNSTFFVTTQMLFIEARGNHYAINFTQGTLKSFKFPLNNCNGSAKYSVTRKLMSHYVISRICLQENNINIGHIMVDLETNINEMADFSKFRVPLLLLSFAMIIYVTVKNKKKENSEDDQEKFIKEMLLKGGINPNEMLNEQESNSYTQPGRVQRDANRVTVPLGSRKEKTK